MRKYLLILIAAVGFAGLTKAKGQSMMASSDTLTLNQAIHNVLQNQPGLMEIKDQVDAAQARIQQAHIGYMPKVAANADYSHINPVPSFVFAGGNSVNIAPYNNYNFNVGIEQTVYDFGRTKANIALAQSQLLTTQDRSNVVKWTLSYYTVQVYYSVLFLEHSIKVENDQIKTLEHDLELVKKRQESGTATNYDLLTTKVQIAAETNRKTDLQNERDKQLIALRKLMGWKQSRTLTVTGNFSSDDTMADLNYGAVNISKRPDYQILKDKLNIYQKQYDLARTIELPSLDAGASAGFKDGYPKSLNKLYGNWDVGLNLRVPIFSGYISRYKQQEARANIRSVDAEKEDLQRTVDAQVANARSDYESSRKKLSTAQLQIRQAQEQIKLARIRYEDGVITSQDLLDSETKLAQARLQRLEYIYQMTLSRYDLEKALGVTIW